MSNKHKDLEGAINVNGDLTPISRQPISQLDSSDWENMTISELTEQRASLYNRMMLAQSMGQTQLISTMQRGLQYMDSILQDRGVFEETHLL